MKKILVAPLNWGLGHATRCIPIIKALIEHQLHPIIASDGQALQLLEKEFPDLEAVSLPSYNITYAAQGKKFKLKLIQDSPHLLKTIKKERAATRSLIKSHAIDGIISDNRFGVRSKKVPSVFMTHQLRVLSGSTTWLSTALHQKIISKFDVCWVPDHQKEPSLSGELGHADILDTPIKYLGPLSRLNKTKAKKEYKLLVLLSGPEPQRSFLEEQLLHSLESYPHPCLFVRGVIEDEICYQKKGKLKIYNYLTSEQLERSINSSELIICRSGYTTIMDLAKLEKKAFFIPTPGQFEQEYLAERFMEKGIAPCASQEDFQLDWLSEVDNYIGFKNLDSSVNFKDLFDLF